MTTKTLLMLRHAKSSWSDSKLDDHDRPLNSRGRDASRRIGHLLNGEDFKNGESLKIELVLCSTSTRTRETAKLVFAELVSPPAIIYRDDLYHSTPDQILEILSQIDEPIQCVMVIGHNPGFDDFFASLTGEAIHFPTAGLARIDLELDHWNSFDNQTHGRLAQFWRPKEIEVD